MNLDRENKQMSLKHQYVLCFNLEQSKVLLPKMSIFILVHLIFLSDSITAAVHETKNKYELN